MRSGARSEAGAMKRNSSTEIRTRLRSGRLWYRPFLNGRPLGGWYATKSQARLAILDEGR